MVEQYIHCFHFSDKEDKICELLFRVVLSHRLGEAEIHCVYLGQLYKRLDFSLTPLRQTLLCVYWESSRELLLCL